MKRFFWVLLIAGWFMAFAPQSGDVLSQNKDIRLEQPPESLDYDLMKALKERHSTRMFTSKEVSLKDLSTILWSAYGINRKGGERTVPTLFGAYFFHIYVAANNAVYRYEPVEHKLVFISDENIKYDVATQPDIPGASHILIITAKKSELPVMGGNGPRLMEMVNAAAGCIAQNVYLTAGALHLGTRMVYTINAKGVIDGLRLTKDDIPMYVMPVGYTK